MDVVVRSNHEEIFAFSHEVEMRDFDHPGLTTPLRYTLISNKITKKMELKPFWCLRSSLALTYHSCMTVFPRQNQQINQTLTGEAAHDKSLGH